MVINSCETNEDNIEQYFFSLCNFFSPTARLLKRENQQQDIIHTEPFLTLDTYSEKYFKIYITASTLNPYIKFSKCRFVLVVRTVRRELDCK